MPPLLILQGLEAVADGAWVMRDVSLEVAEGSTVAVVGGAAAGKSLLLELLLGLRPLRAGSLRFAETELANLRPLARQRLGLRAALQTPPIFPGLSVAEHLALAISSVRLERDAFARIADYLPELGEHLARPVEALDLPLRRLVDLGRALLGLPRLLLIDSLLPAVGIERGGALLEALGRDGYTLLIADRYAEAALGHATYGYVLAQGRMLAAGRPERLLADGRLLASCAGDPNAYA